MNGDFLVKLLFFGRQAVFSVPRQVFACEIPGNPNCLKVLRRIKIELIVKRKGRIDIGFVNGITAWGGL